MANPKSIEASPSSPAPAGAETETPRHAPPRDTSRDAVVIQNASGTLCRPPPGMPLHTLGQVVIGNWTGHVDGKDVLVSHGTPVLGLPAAVLQKIRETPEQKIGPFDTRKKSDQTPALAR